jgi:hypothetical protein
MPAFQNYQIAAGWNNAAGLVNIGLIVPSSHIAFVEPIAKPNWNPGIQRIRLDGLSYSAGYSSQTWTLGFVTLQQYDYLLSTYTGGGQSGKVTIKTRYRNHAYANYNAIMSIPIPDELQATGQLYQSVPVTFRKLVAL